MPVRYDTRFRYVPGEAGELFLAEYIPRNGVNKLIVLVPPLAEEMNRARRMFSLQAKCLAAEGLHVCIPDLFGTGDSDGEFSDASWEIWRADIKSAVVAASGTASPEIALLGLRAGALLALDAMHRHSIPVQQLVFWSPCISGELFITQFLRTRVVADMLAKSRIGESMAGLRSRLQAGESLEIAGYLVRPELVNSIATLQLDELAVKGTPSIFWFEMVGEPSRQLPPAVERVTSKIRGKGVAVHAAVTTGPPFWATSEIAVAPDLLAATAAVLVGHTRP